MKYSTVQWNNRKAIKVETKNCLNIIFKFSKKIFFPLSVYKNTILFLSKIVFIKNIKNLAIIILSHGNWS